MTPFEWVAILAGPAGVGPGLWRIGTALCQRARAHADRARADEQLLDAIVRLLANHEARITALEQPATTGKATP